MSQLLPGRIHKALPLLLLALSNFNECTAYAATLAEPTFDTDSYVFVGTNALADAGITISTDYSGGIVDAANVHFSFGVIKYDDLTGLDVKANGGPDKLLKLSVAAFPGPALIGVSAATADIESAYPSFMFPGNPPGDELDRQQWYIDNIKGNDGAYGGYAGGAAHLGVVDVDHQGTFFLDVTETVDAWIDGAQPNYGFGLWGVDVSGGQGDPFDFASRENSMFPATSIVSEIPEPASAAIALAAALVLFVIKRPRLDKFTNAA